jgi:hypothetical protein
MAYNYISRNEILSNNYRRVEACYRRGDSNHQIATAFGLSIIDVLDITQKIFALDQKKLEWSKRNMPEET